MKNKIKLVICDIDRTVVYGSDTDAFYCEFSTILEKLVARKNGIALTDAKVIVDKVRAENGGRGEKIFDSSGYKIIDWYDAIVADSRPEKLLHSDTKINSLLEKIRDNYTLIALTDAPVELGERILLSRGVKKELFHEYIGWQRGECYPKGGRTHSFEMIMEKYKLKPEEILMIGDSLGSDIEPASSLGINTLYISKKRHNDYTTIKSFDEVIDIII